MASIIRTLLPRSRQYSPRIQCCSPSKHAAQWRRALSSTPIPRADEDTRQDPAGIVDSKTGKEDVQEKAGNDSLKAEINAPEPLDRPPLPKEVRQMSKTAREAYREAEPGYMLDAFKSGLNELDPDVAKEAMRKGKQGVPFGTEFNLEGDQDFEIEEDDKRRVGMGFWAEGEPSMGPDEDYFGDDLTSAGHGELQKHRELREYARLIAWELPLLSQLARPFEPPVLGQPFRFRYTSYFGESHPAANKVVVEFTPGDLSLTEPQVSKLIKLCGPRYNPGTTIIKLSCEKFDTQAQNKRFLGETIQDLIAEAKDEKDLFEDVPFDFRHHKPKPRHEFPKEWILTKERKQYLQDKWRKAAQLEDERLHNGKLLDGQTIIDTSLPPIQTPETEPVMVNASMNRPS